MLLLVISHWLVEKLRKERCTQEIHNTIRIIVFAAQRYREYFLMILQSFNVYCLVLLMLRPQLLKVNGYEMSCKPQQCKQTRDYFLIQKIDPTLNLRTRNEDVLQKVCLLAAASKAFK